MLKIGEAKKAVIAAVKGYLLKDEMGNYRVPPMYRMPLYLEGAPGIGKTEICAQVAKQMQIGFVSYSLVHCTKNNILGLPVIKELKDGRKYTIYTMSEIIAAVNKAIEDGQNEGILLLDEFPCISDTIAPMMLAFLQSKTLGEYRLPDGWIIMLAGNPSKYNKSVRTFDMATLDRIRKIELMQDTNDYLEYGEKTGVHHAILDYLKINPEECYHICNEKRDAIECVTCRSWSNLSEALLVYEELGQEEAIDLSFAMQFIKSEMIARKFMEYYVQSRHDLTVDELEQIYAGNEDSKKEEKLACLTYAEKWKLAGMIISYTVNHTVEMSHVSNGEMEHSAEEIGAGLNNMFCFLDRLDKTRELSGRLADAISNSSQMMSIVSIIPVEQYEKHLMYKYGIA